MSPPSPCGSRLEGRTKLDTFGPQMSRKGVPMVTLMEFNHLTCGAKFQSTDIFFER